MKSIKKNNGYLVTYKGITRFVAKGHWGWIAYDSENWENGSCGLPTLKEQKQSLKYLIDNNYIK
jgi:hypothetical protein